MNPTPRYFGVLGAVLLLASASWPGAALAQSVTGSAVNHSTWNNRPPPGPPPGDGSGAGRLLVGAWGGGSVAGAPVLATVLTNTAALPLPDGASFDFNLGPLSNATFLVAAWIDANANSRYDPGEPASAPVTVAISSNGPVAGVNLTIVDDLDADTMPDWWEVRWFGDTTALPGEDADRAGLTNVQEYNISRLNALLATLSPVNWDSDGDRMDDKWEYDHYAAGTGLIPTVNDASADADGDGLTNLQEYNGVDGLPRMEHDPLEAAGVGRLTGSGDDLNPIDLDTDGDSLIDSFEAAWYDPAHGIDPKASGDPTADPDEDGLSSYREQCLLAELRQGGANDIWTGGRESIPATNAVGVRAFAPKLALGATLSTIQVDLPAVRKHEWTDPTHGSGYAFEQPVSGNDGWDTDGDQLPDGWEVEFNLDPRSGESLLLVGTNLVINPNGFWGDPDHDGLINAEEYLGQDGDRSTNKLYIAGSGDETDPNQYNWRPDSTTDGTGVARPPYLHWWISGLRGDGTLGAALPTRSRGTDSGLDTDDDGIPDALEIQQEYSSGVVGSSPVHSMSPFVRRAALITAAAGISVPDPEGSSLDGYRADMHGRDWTLECYVKILAAGRSGYLVKIPGPLGLAGRVDLTCALSLSNDVPVASFQTAGGFLYSVAGLALPTGQWTHVAGVWDQTRNTLALYVDGIFVQEARIYQEGVARYDYSCDKPPTVGESSAGPASFANALMIDEVRIWRTPRSAGQIEQYRRKLLPPNSTNLLAYYRFDDGGATAEDFARRAKTGLLGAPSTDLTFGDHGYALRANSFTLSSTDAAEVFGVSENGADDQDGDGLPDDWEMMNHLDPTSAVGDDGAMGDPDGDGLVNLYEFWSRTNPHAPDTNQNGIPDDQEDFDGDGLPNGVEQALGSRPDMIDTDDDGLPDNIEQASGTSPANPVDPSVSRCMRFGGSTADYVTVPTSARQRLTDWTLEAWVNADSAADATGTIIRRAVQRLSAGGYAMNYVLGLQTNASGIVPYAGYVTATGNTYVVRGTAIPAGTWVHLAATYDSKAIPPTLMLYTNGVLSAVSNGQFQLPPANGKGGETFVRIGEDFKGYADEIRVWDVTRRPTDVQAGYNRLISGTSSGLVHYFEFDDGQATNTFFPFGPFHQPHGPQDFTYTNDWNVFWQHAGIIHGNSDFAQPGALLAPPAIQVTLEPMSARAAGAAWSLDGGIWLSSGQMVPNLSQTNLIHTIQYQVVPGWTAPPTELVVVTNGSLMSLVRYYAENGSLTVTIQPVDAVTGGAQWAVDGGPWHNSGETVNNLIAGNHTVVFKDTYGWTKPADVVATLTPGQAATAVGTYTRITASLRIFVEPQRAIDDGARWLVDGATPARISGELVTNLSLGTHEVSFSTLPLWTTPSNQVVNLTNTATIVSTGRYSQATGMAVTLVPSAAVQAGAQWRVNGGSWLNSGVIVELAPGSYTVDFLPLSGWAYPSPIVATVVTNALTRIVGTYVQYTVIGTPGPAVGQFNKPRGMALAPDRRLYVADSDNNRIQIWNPANSTWSAIGSYGTNAGMFKQPFGVVVDSSYNLFVADANNNRVQRRAAATGTWTVWGGTATGTGQGTFNGPFGVALDASGSLYVSDHYNNRVQKMTPSGVWSTFIASGFGNGFVRTPYGIAVDGFNRIYITDYDSTATNGYSRLQQFNSNGQFLALLGSSLPAQGGLNRPAGLAIRPTGGIFIADTDSSRIVTNAGPALTWGTLVDSIVLSLPEGVAWDPQGVLYVSDTGHGRVLRLSLPDLINKIPLLGLAVSGPPAGGFVVTWQGQSGWTYTVQYTDRLQDQNSWTDVPAANSVTGHDGVMSCTDTNIGGVSARTYRVYAY